MTNERVILTKEEYDDMMAQMAYLQEELGKLLSGDNVSVSAREYGQLLYANENVQKEIEDAVEKARKETARDFAHKYLEWLSGNTVRNPMQAFLEFLKQQGLEVE